ncbi:MAG: hypothetical protein JST90_07250 [Bacteroidetes bacterium]|nr:hypothetical protein [Bacteroidota bacterium]
MLYRWSIPYDKFLYDDRSSGHEQKVEVFLSVIYDYWITLYKDNSKAYTAITRLAYKDFVFLFDDTDELISQGKAKTHEVPEGRVVAAFGFSKEKKHQRSNYRVQSYLGPTSKVFGYLGGAYDKGHFISDASGGPKEINLFPHKRALNRGWSEEGKIYRRMEQTIADNPGTFFFSRPFYNDATYRPFSIEYGFVLPNGEFQSRIFKNI